MGFMMYCAVLCIAVWVIGLCDGMYMRGPESHPCHSLTSQHHIAEATSHLLHISPSNDLHIIFHGTPDECLIKSIWSYGISTGVSSEEKLWNTLDLASYSIPGQYALVGPLQWIVGVMGQVTTLYTSAKMNAMKTHWFWIVTDTSHPFNISLSSSLYSNSSSLPHLSSPSSVPSPSISPSSSSSSSSFSSSSSPSFLSVMQYMENVLIEGMRGLLIMPQPSNFRSSAEDRWVVVVGSVNAPGDGTWKLRRAGTWSYGTSHFHNSLWPRPSFNLYGRTLRINVLKKPTVFLFSGNETLTSAVGYAADITRLIQGRLNFTDALVPNTGFGAFNKGAWNGMVGDLLRGEADVSPMDFTPIWQRTLVIDFGLIYSTDNVVIISRAPRAFIRPMLLLEIFTPLVWVCLVGAVIFTGVVVGGLVWALRDMGVENDKGVIQYCTATFKIMVYQSSSWWPKWNGSRIVCGMMMFMAVVVGSLYRGSITAFLAIPSKSQPINSLEDLLETSLVPAIRRLSSPYSFFLTENSGLVGKHVRGIMDVFSGSEMSKWKFLKRVADGTYGFIDTASSAIGRSGQFEKMGQPCLFHVGRNPLRMDLDAFAYPKNSPIKYQFDEVMRWLRSYGIIEYIKGQYYSKACGTDLSSDGPAAISLIQAQGAFYVLGVGLVTAGSAFIVELILLRFCS